MALDLQVLDHLGINLYSNAAAVLSEAVANCWDADATKVSIDIKPATITIDDNGIGMALKDVNARFLKVGYKKRDAEGDTSDKGRPFMGRKGIGKLALFSIAETIDIHTVRKGEKHAFRMQTKALRRAIEGDKDYRPTPLEYAGGRTGTRIVLSDLKKKRTSRVAAALRKRIARRFSIIGYQDGKGDRFDVVIDGEPVGAGDREDLKAIEFLWEFGDEEVISEDDCPSLKKRFLIPNEVTTGRPEWIVNGWFGAAAKPAALKHEDAGPMNGLVVLARGRLIQENILDKLTYSRILSSYLTGQIEADFLDVKGEEDIATSDRQRLIEDDERYVALITFLRQTLVGVSDEWTRYRNELRGKEAIAMHPALDEWIQTLPEGGQQKAAERMFGLIQGIWLDDEQQRKGLYRAGMVACERLRLREEAHQLGKETALDAETLLPLLADLASLEGSMYRDIVQARLDVIRKFEGLVDANEKEKVLQKHLFENLWLLDPGWERATGSERIEQKLKREFKEFSTRLTDKESKGRVDIRYRTNAGEHMIVELKRAKRKLRVTELIEQGDQYRKALMKCLKQTGIEIPHISIVFVLGEPVVGQEPEQVKQMLQVIHARVVYYEELIHSARDAYAEYLKMSGKTDKLDKLLKKLS